MALARNPRAPRYLIYALIDPRTCQVRYVGKSCQGLTRPRAHCRYAATAQTYCARWIRQLLSIGFAYEIRVLAWFATDIPLCNAERDWIAFGRAEGWPLTNLTDGGDGVSGRPASDRLRHAAKSRVYTAEQKARISAAKIGNKHTLGFVHTEESRRMMSEAQRRRFAERPHSAETKAKISKSKSGISTWSAETRARAAERMRGRPPRYSNKGKAHSWSTRVLIRDAVRSRYGKPLIRINLLVGSP